MKNKIGLVFVVALLTTPLMSCLSIGGQGILFVQEEQKEDWVKFYELDPKQENTIPDLISNVSLRAENKFVCIDPSSPTNRLYWLKPDGKIVRSFQDKFGQVSHEQFFKVFSLPEETRKVFIDWAINNEKRKDEWRQDHFIYYLDKNGAFWAVNTKMETAERYCENIIVPADAESIYIDFKNKEYPIIYTRKSNTNPIRVNARTGFEQVFLGTKIDGTMIIDELTGDIYEIIIKNNITQIVFYNQNGIKILINEFSYPFDPIAIRIVNGKFFFGISETEVTKYNGKAIF